MNVFCSSGCSLPFSQKKKKKAVWPETNQSLKENEILSQALENPSVDLVRIPYGSNFDCAVGRASSPPRWSDLQLASHNNPYFPPKPWCESGCHPPGVSFRVPFPLTEFSLPHPFS